MATLPSSTSRRVFLATTAGAFAAGTLARPLAATETPGALMTERAKRLVGLLGEAGRSAATFAFDDRTRRGWNFMGASPKPGLRLEEMTAEQKTAALDLLASGLNADGVRKAETVMLLQDVLREMGGGRSDRNRERFSIALFGTPSVTAPWGWRFEGHHLSLSFTLLGTQVIGVTPSSFSSNPNIVNFGAHRGTVALVEEEQLARRVYVDLAPKHRDVALISERAFGNILTTAGREDRFADERAGVPLADLHPSQADLLVRLAEVYAVDHLVPALAEEQRARLREGDLMATRFAWAGSDREGEMMYYRLHGATFLIEFASLRNQPLHLHTVRHDLERHLGAHLLS